MIRCFVLPWVVLPWVVLPCVTTQIEALCVTLYTDRVSMDVCNVWFVRRLQVWLCCG